MMLNSGFLALWNGCNAEVGTEYNLWHNQEHVPQRLTLPNFMAANRYVDGVGDLPSYLTVYEVATLEALRSSEYMALLANPTPWSQRMRPHLTQFRRHCCEEIASAGGGVSAGAAAAIVTTRGKRLGRDAIKPFEDFAEMTRLRIGHINAELDGLHWRTAGTPVSTDGSERFVIVLESFSRDRLRDYIRSTEGLNVLAALGDEVVADWTDYAFAFSGTKVCG